MAIPLLVEITSIKRAKLNPSDPNLLLNAIFLLGVAYSQTGQFDKSVPLFKELLKVREAKHGRDSVATLIVVANLGVSYLHTDRLKRGRLRCWKKSLGREKDPQPGVVGNALARCLCEGQGERQGRHLAQGLGATPKDGPTLAQQLASYGQSLLQAKAFTEAEAVFRECLAIREKTQPNTWTPFDTKSLPGRGVLLGQKKYADAELLLLSGYEGMKQRKDTIPAEVCMPAR